MHPPDTILCKPIVISSCQQFLKSEIYKFKLTTHSAYKLFSQPWESHEVWLFDMVDSGLCHGLTHFAMPQTIYLKSELQSATHLVSLDAYNFFHCCNNHWRIFRNIEFKYFQPLAYQYYQNSFTSRNHYHTKIARYSHIIYSI